DDAGAVGVARGPEAAAPAGAAGAAPAGGGHLDQMMRPERRRGLIQLMSRLVLLVLAALVTVPGTAAASVNYASISHKGLKNLGAASTKTKLTLQLGFIAN